MSTDGDPAAAADEPPLVERLLDRLDAYRVLSEHDESEALAQLEALGIDGTAEADMIAELSSREILAHPDRFVDAHIATMKALEVLDRNRSRRPALRVGGPLRPVARSLVGQFAAMQIESYERKVLNALGEIYRRREAQTIHESGEHHLLRRARKQVERLRAEMTGGGPALTKLLVGGAAFSLVSTAFSSLLDTINAHWWVFVIVTAGFVAFALATFWVILQSAAVARKRIRIALDRPLPALYETIGGVGAPPRDPTRQFALYSLIALVVGWVVVPAAIGLLLWPD